jgi:hypothetical protein
MKWFMLEGVGVGDGNTNEKDEVFFYTRDSFQSMTSSCYNFLLTR